MKKFIGDLSREDAALLESYASKARSVLEFGMGGSTQIIAQSIPEWGSFISLDTEMEWRDKTRKILRRLGVENRCVLLAFEDWPKDRHGYDLIFNDGKNSMRREFGLQSFPLLSIGGALLFHDTRRAGDIENVMAVVGKHFEEIEYVLLNEKVGGVSSNITVIRKKAREPYTNWNATEGKHSWEVGYGEIPEEFWTR